VSGRRLKSIELRDVSLRYGRHWAVRDLSFTLRAGERWLLVGANGAGKTVFMKLLRGELWPTPTGREQRIYQFGRETHTQPAFASERIGYLGPERQDRYERHGLSLRVDAVVGTGFHDLDIPLGRLTSRQQSDAIDALRQVGLAGLAARNFLSLSYGQRRRVLLARLLVRRPDVLLLDEALNGLDAAARRAFLHGLARACGPTTAWILSSHRRGEVPTEVTHALRMEHGRIVAAGPIEVVRPSLFGPVRAAPAAVRRGATPKSVPSSPPRPLRQPTGRNPARKDLLRLHDVTLYRDYRAVVPRFDWVIEAGEHWCVIGRNGSGKSSLVQLLYGDMWPAYGGRIERPQLGPHVVMDDWKRRTGLVSPELQAAYAATGCTVQDIVVSGLHSSIGLNEFATPAERKRARRVLAQFGIIDLESRRARELSYGQLRLVLFARAFVARRRVLLLDEPFDGLAPDALLRVRVAVDAAVRAGTQLILATHHREDIPQYVRRYLELRAGRRPMVTSRP